MNSAKKPLSRTSAKRAAEIASGQKMQGSFKIDLAAIRARQGTMMDKVADALFGKAKGPQKPRKAMKRTPMNTGRKATGEAKLFAEPWEIRRHDCVVCGAHIEEPAPINFSHLLPRGSYRSMRMDPRNVHIKCAACHHRWHQYGAAGLRYSFQWRNVIRMYDDLKEEYNLRMSAELSGRA